MSFESVLITGANRGLGLEFVRQLLASKPSPKYLIATTRQSANEELDRLKASNASLHVLQLDTKNYSQYEQFVRQVEQIVSEEGIDTLINNAGILINKDMNTVTVEDMIENFNVNSVSPLMLTKALLPLLKKSSAKRKTTVVNISSALGSIERNGCSGTATAGGIYPYRTSKAALNMITKNLAIDLKPSGINVIAMHPGWVKTDLGGPSAPLTPSTSVSNMIKSIGNINDSVLGRMLDNNGSVLPN